MQNKHLFKLLLVLFLVLGLGLSSAFADLVTLSVDDGANLLLVKGNFAVDSGIAYKVITAVKKDGDQIFMQTVTLGPGASKAKRTGPDFQYLAKLVIDPEGDKLIVRYEQSGVRSESQYVGTVKVKVNDTGELAYFCKGTLGTPRVVPTCFNPSDYVDLYWFIEDCNLIAACGESCEALAETEDCQACISGEEDRCDLCSESMVGSGDCTNICGYISCFNPSDYEENPVGFIEACENMAECNEGLTCEQLAETENCQECISNPDLCLDCAADMVLEGQCANVCQ